jgi:hypothetical protein
MKEISDHQKDKLPYTHGWITKSKWERGTHGWITMSKWEEILEENHTHQLAAPGRMERGRLRLDAIERVERLIPGRGSKICNLWQTRLMRSQHLHGGSTMS